MVIMKRFSFFVLYSTLFAISLYAQVIAPSLPLGSERRLTLQEGRADGGLLVGTTLNKTALAKSVATLKNGADGLGFYPNSSTTSVRANTAYLPESKQLLIDLSTLDAPLTNIQNTEIGKGKSSNGKFYDLSGRKTGDGHLPRGIYVTNKQKFAVKP